MGGFLCCFFFARVVGLVVCVVRDVACSYIYRGGAVHFFLSLVVAMGLGFLYSL